MTLNLKSINSLPNRDALGRFVKKGSSNTPIDPPLVKVEVTNPVTFIKAWWKKIIGNEGIEIKIRVKPLTTVAVILMVLGFSFGVEKIATPFGIFSSKVIPTTPTPTADPARDTAITGILRKTPSTNKYYLQTDSTEAVSIIFSFDVDLTNYIGKRILISGKYNQKAKTILVSDIVDLEILPKTPVPVITPIPTSTATPVATPTSTLEPSLTPLPSNIAN